MAKQSAIALLFSLLATAAEARRRGGGGGGWWHRPVEYFWQGVALTVVLVTAIVVAALVGRRRYRRQTYGYRTSQAPRQRRRGWLSYREAQFWSLCALIVGIAAFQYFQPTRWLPFGWPSTPRTTLLSGTTEDPIQGRASVIDGDTVDIAGERVRFSGIDAPETDQPCKNASGETYRCGTISANALDEFLAKSRPLRCEYVDRDQYGRFVGECFRADGASVAEWLVANGHAMDWPRYSYGKYSAAQQKAKVKKLGIWQGNFEAPWDWRHEGTGEQDEIAPHPDPAPQNFKPSPEPVGGLY